MIRDRVMESFDAKVPKTVRWGVMFAVTNVLWLLFRSADLAQFGAMMSSLFSFRLTLDPVLTHTVTDPLPLWALLALAFLTCLALPNASRRIFRATFPQAALTALIAVWSLLSLGGSSTFVYFNF